MQLLRWLLGLLFEARTPPQINNDVADPTFDDDVLDAIDFDAAPPADALTADAAAARKTLDDCKSLLGNIQAAKPPGLGEKLKVLRETLSAAAARRPVTAAKDTPLGKVLLAVPPAGSAETAVIGWDDRGVSYVVPPEQWTAAEREAAAVGVSDVIVRENLDLYGPPNDERGVPDVGDPRDLYGAKAPMQTRGEKLPAPRVEALVRGQRAHHMTVEQEAAEVERLVRAKAREDAVRGLTPAEKAAFAAAPGALEAYLAGFADEVWAELKKVRANKTLVSGRHRARPGAVTVDMLLGTAASPPAKEPLPQTVEKLIAASTPPAALLADGTVVRQRADGAFEPAVQIIADPANAGAARREAARP